MWLPHPTSEELAAEARETYRQASSAGGARVVHLVGTPRDHQCPVAGDAPHRGVGRTGAGPRELDATGAGIGHAAEAVVAGPGSSSTPQIPGYRYRNSGPPTTSHRRNPFTIRVFRPPCFGRPRRPSAEIRSQPVLFSCVGVFRVHNRPRLASVVLGGLFAPIPAPRT